MAKNRKYRNKWTDRNQSNDGLSLWFDRFHFISDVQIIIRRHQNDNDNDDTVERLSSVIKWHVHVPTQNHNSPYSDFGLIEDTQPYLSVCYWFRNFMKPLHESNLNELNTVIIAARDLICDKLYMWLGLKWMAQMHGSIAKSAWLLCAFFADESSFSYRRPRSNANKILTK